MTGRIPLDHLTSDQLDALYDQRDELAEAAKVAARRLVHVCGAMPQSQNFYVTKIRFAINLLRSACPEPTAHTTEEQQL